MSVAGLRAIHRAAVDDRRRQLARRAADIARGVGIAVFDVAVLGVLAVPAIAFVGYLASFWV